MKEETPVPPANPAGQDHSLAIVSMVLGAVSLTGPGLILGIPAIILAIIALKKENGSRGLSITGLVTGIISTVFSLIIMAIIVLAVIWGSSHPEEMKDYDNHSPKQGEQLFRSSEI